MHFFFFLAFWRLNLGALCMPGTCTTTEKVLSPSSCVPPIVLWACMGRSETVRVPVDKLGRSLRRLVSILCFLRMLYKVTFLLDVRKISFLNFCCWFYLVLGANMKSTLVLYKVNPLWNDNETYHSVHLISLYMLLLKPLDWDAGIIEYLILLCSKKLYFELTFNSFNRHLFPLRKNYKPCK